MVLRKGAWLGHPPIPIGCGEMNGAGPKEVGLKGAGLTENWAGPFVRWAWPRDTFIHGGAVGGA